MNSLCFSLLFVLSFQYSMAQTPTVRPLEQLINKDEPAWPQVKKWIDEATNKVEVLAKDKERADKTLYETQVTTRSPMGAIIYETGGILIDYGWIRILGSGNPRLNRSLTEWNQGKSFTKSVEVPSYLLIADDVLGGFYAINAGGISKEGIGKVFYFAPDNLNWEPMDMSYTDFILFCFSGNVKQYYETYRWKDWKKDVENLDGNSGISVYPFLWTKEGQADINKNSRSPVPMQELWELYFEQKNK